MVKEIRAQTNLSQRNKLPKFYWPFFVYLLLIVRHSLWWLWERAKRKFYQITIHTGRGDKIDYIYCDDVLTSQLNEIEIVDGSFDRCIVQRQINDWCHAWGCICDFLMPSHTGVRDAIDQH